MTWFMRRLLCLISGCIAILLLCINVHAAGPAKIAKTNRSLWPYPINSPAAFDFASQMEMLVFAEVFITKSTVNKKEDLIAFTGLKNVSVASVTRWQSAVWAILTKNFNSIDTFHPDNFLKLTKPVLKSNIIETTEKLKHLMPEKLIPWYQDSRRFYSYYLYEQMRLAALFPRITSEILKLDDSEVQGFGNQDKSFQLTFDDGPSIKKGNTDKLISVLNAYKVSGIFFVLGENVKKRLKTDSQENLKTLYKDMKLGSHAMVHKSHAKYNLWQQSLDDTKKLIDLFSSGNAEPFYFRPPYGQRTLAVVDHLKKSNSRVMLWNIDSQDWNKKISAEETADRVTSLMLLWRSGIILYHDVYSKATTAMPIIINRLDGSGVNWL